MSGGLRSPRRTSAEDGFTIVELMIASLVFSVILMVITVGVIKFTGAYYKGVNVSTTQDVARSISDTVTQAVQFGSTTVTPTDKTDTNLYASNSGLFCAGGNAFVYSHAKYTGGAPTKTNAGLYMMRMPSAVCQLSDIPTNLTGGQELLGKNMRLTNIVLEGVGGGVYNFAVTVAYGNNDSLCVISGTPTSDCAIRSAVPTDADLIGQSSNLRCRSGTGSEYCAVSTLNNSVKKRVGE